MDDDLILGFDLGTTNSVVSVIRNGKVEVLRENDEAILPSVVGLNEEGKLLVGAVARNQAVLSPERTVRSIKRQMGQDTKVKLGDQLYSPQEISAMILRTLKERAEKALGQDVRKAVITVPAFFNENQRQATREAGELAGLEVVRIINEPTAASLVYEAQAEGLERLLVYDLGGGTFDVSVVQIEEGVVEVLASHGDTQLGGDDFDQLLSDYVCEEFQQEHDVDLHESPTTKSRVLRAVEEAKKRLSAQPFTQIEEEFIAEKDGRPIHLKMELNRHRYEDLIEHLLDKTLKCVDDAMDDAKLQAQQIDRVILVGGSSRTPRVHELLRDRLGQPLHGEVDPDLCVSMGAAVQGGMISGAEVNQVLVDITSHTLGIQTLGYLQGFRSSNCFSPIIERNSSLPASRSEVYYTAYDNQEKVCITVFQGEDDDVRHNTQIGEFYLEELRKVQQGNEIVVRFNLDLDGILNVTATEKATSRERQITIENALTRYREEDSSAARARLDAVFGSSSSESVVGLAESESEAEADVSPAGLEDVPPELEESSAKAQELIAKAENLKKSASPDDREEIEQLVGQLRQAVADQSPPDIDRTIAQLDDLVFYLQDF